MYRFTLLAACTLLFQFFGFAQEQLESQSKANPIEKVHIHMDKPFYSASDIIWYKAYVVEGTTSKPTHFSNILNIDLIGPDGKIKIQQKIAINSGLGWGSIALSDDMPEGSYRLRAYTRLMQNFGPEFFFDHSFKVGNYWNNEIFVHSNFRDDKQEPSKIDIQFVNKQKQPIVGKNVAITMGGTQTMNAITDKDGRIYLDSSLVSSRTSPVIDAVIQIDAKQKVQKYIPLMARLQQVDVQFLPEGGQLVVGLPGKVAVKATRANGLGVSVSGKIIDNDGNEMAEFSTSNMGTGIFFMNPIAGKKYRAVFQSEYPPIDLPLALDRGYVLSVNNSDSLKFTVKAFISPDLLNKGALQLVAQHNGAILFSTRIPTAKPMATVTLIKSNFPTGIIQLSLLTSENIPVAERIIFVRNKVNTVNLSVSGLKRTYSKWSPVNFSFQASNESLPVLGSFSVAVTNSELVSPDVNNETNILSSLLLLGDLRGYVQDPNQYFTENNSRTNDALDALMLTQGWRKIAWSDSQSDTLPAPKYTAEKALQISGHVTSNSGKYLPGVRLSLFSSQNLIALDTISDKGGRFVFDRLQFDDSTKFILQAKSETDKRNIKIVLDSIPTPMLTSIKTQGEISLNVNKELSPYLEKSAPYFAQLAAFGKSKKGMIDIEEVEIGGKRKKLVINSANYNGAVKADQVITAKDLEHSFTLVDYIKKGGMPGIAYDKGKTFMTRINSLSSVKILQHDDGSKSQDMPPIAVIFDGIRVSNDLIQYIQTEEIESIEVLKNNSLTLAYGENDGVLIITSKQPGLGSYERSIPGLKTILPKGLAVSREFYIPKFDKPNDLDLRTTVYWNPIVATDFSGKGTVSFPNTSQPGIHRIVIEGIDADGNLARFEAHYAVE